jgi:hypothetical protein
MRQTEEVALRVGFAMFSATAAIAAPPAASDPWAVVPTFPTGYYAHQDNFSVKVAEASEAASKAYDRQEKINSTVSDRVKALSPEELQARMQTFMMENPEEAMKLMQQNQAIGETITDVRLKAEAKRQALDGELKDLQARYTAALASARAPLDARFKDLDARAQKDLVAVGESWSYAPWAVKEHNGLVTQWNAASEKVFGEWWSASRPFPSWLARYREYLIKDVIPSREEADNLGNGFMVHLVDTPDASFKSTATLDAVREYIRQVGDVFGKREGQPKSSM